MLAWYLSKVFTTAVIFILIAVTLSIFNYERGSSCIQLELDTVGNTIADIISEIGRIESNISIKIVFHSDVAEDKFIVLNPRINDRYYRIEIYRELVVVKLDSMVSVNKFTTIAHLWKPADTELTTTDVIEFDRQNLKLILEAGESFVIERKLMSIDGKQQYLTFIYPETEKQ